MKKLIILVLFLTGCGPGYIKTPTPPLTPSPTPGLDANTIIAQALATSVGAGTYASLADTNAAHPTLTPVPTPEPSEVERVAVVLAWPLFGTVFVIGLVVVVLSGLAALYTTEKRRATDLRAQAALEAAERQIERTQARMDRVTE